MCTYTVVQFYKPCFVCLLCLVLSHSALGTAGSRGGGACPWPPSTPSAPPSSAFSHPRRSWGAEVICAGIGKGVQNSLCCVASTLRQTRVAWHIRVVFAFGVRGCIFLGGLRRIRSVGGGGHQHSNSGVRVGRSFPKTQVCACVHTDRCKFLCCSMSELQLIRVSETKLVFYGGARSRYLEVGSVVPSPRLHWCRMRCPELG